MAGAAAAYVLNDRQRFRGFFRTLPSLEFAGQSLAEIARQFEWTQMAIITQRESLFYLVCVYFYKYMYLTIDSCTLHRSQKVWMPY